ncbi:guanine nucleotide-binding protein G(s) subunit alpha [Harmonia axyridis]|uniref:guanine nucleotide-binding protein G(s) subunit alpha n=1 Tax=Harmonia axyridis TaxID=115357 RepID=UPI001E276349|nr:guanine nucleotide-binding protein G(s) subunit alpha [Harmonia axyridis]
MSERILDCGCIFPLLPCFYTPSPDDAMGKQKSDEIDRQLGKERKEFQKAHRLLLLGAGESGKSTVIKQMYLIHVKNFSEKMRIEKRNDIRGNLVESIVSILEAMPKLSPTIEIADPDNREKANWILSQSYQSEKLPEEFYNFCSSLWKDKGVQAAFERSNEFQLIDSAQYFIERLDDIRKENYVPTEQDILRCRVLTREIYELVFQVSNVKFRMIDVGGQREERCKWFLCFNDVTAIIFVTDCSSYDMVLREDETKNRLTESLDLFKVVWNNRWLKTISVILFLNKQDIFSGKILSGRRKLERYFPEFKAFKTPEDAKHDLNESSEVTRAKYYIRNEFEKICKHTNHADHRLYPHFTCAVDTENIKRVFDDCRDSIQWKYLKEFDLL